MEARRATDEELNTFLNVLQEGYYWGLLSRVEGEEWEEYLKQRREETAKQVGDSLKNHGE